MEDFIKQLVTFEQNGRKACARCTKCGSGNIFIRIRASFPSINFCEYKDIFTKTTKLNQVCITDVDIVYSLFSNGLSGGKDLMKVLDSVVCRECGAEWGDGIQDYLKELSEWEVVDGDEYKESVKAEYERLFGGK